LWPATCPADDSLKLWKKKIFHYYLDFLSILAWRVVSEAVVHGSFVQLTDEDLCSCDYEHGHYRCASWTCQSWILGDGYMGPTSFPSQFSSIGTVFALQFANARHLCQPLCSTVNCHFLFFCEGNGSGWAYLCLTSGHSSHTEIVTTVC